jgi:hypothetical protein
MAEWFLSLLVITVGAALSFFVAFLWQRSVLWSLRWGLCVVMGGLLSYLYLAVSLPGGISWVQRNSTGGIIGIAAIGILGGWLVGLVWWLLQSTRKFSPVKR